ncbi:hypothetical protein GGTG_04706 [Gaeumannomyces tritici R3-111a-1]|uniref:Uncharacterized protein n=1 Tax=Gaeumannomyces tritici (strain R3-111a-1) TaxID=644352 RepID=J3NTV7_GAET3|nr:hypothetical protein GGTG_04706 [Gaeumannomyces tritici R3-111a-1]EJT79622.1 hypothetical protein GGTG_04706 [Gaeumannomyces tritici R3-111a-1]
MNELRLELDEAKFTTILKELVILHDVNPSSLSPAQIKLFKEAGDDQRRRLVQLWSIFPSSLSPAQIQLFREAGDDQKRRLVQLWRPATTRSAVSCNSGASSRQRR